MACAVEKAGEKLQNPAGFRILVHVNSRDPRIAVTQGDLETAVADIARLDGQLGRTRTGGNIGLEGLILRLGVIEVMSMETSSKSATRSTASRAKVWSICHALKGTSIMRYAA